MQIRKFIETYFDIDDPEKNGRLVPFQFRKPQIKFYNLLCETYSEDLNFEGAREIILKARKEGFTSLVLAIFAAIIILSDDPVRFLEISYKDDATKQHFRRIKTYIVSYYRKKLKAPDGGTLDDETIEKLIFKTINEGSEFVMRHNGASFYVGTASTRTGERGGTVQGVLFTEAAQYPNTGILRAEEIIEATRNQIHVGTGMVFIETTANGVNFFSELWEMAERGLVDYKPRFFSWRDFYTDEEFEVIRKGFKTPEMCRQEYPETPEEAFILSGKPFFNKENLFKIYTYVKTCKPVYVGDLASKRTKEEWTEYEMESNFRLYRIPKFGEYCVIGVDTAEGGDLSTLVCKSAHFFDSFLVMSGSFSSAEFGPYVLRAARFITKLTGKPPLIGIERNMGVSIINYLINEEYQNLYKQEVFDQKLQQFVPKIGWYTSTSNRKKMLDELSVAVNETAESEDPRFYDVLTIKQFLKFVRNKATGKPEAERGCFDDLVMAEAIAEQLVMTAPIHQEDAVVVSPKPRTPKERQLLQVSANPTYNLDALRQRLNKKRGWKSI